MLTLVAAAPPSGAPSENTQAAVGSGALFQPF